MSREKIQGRKFHQSNPGDEITEESVIRHEEFAQFFLWNAHLLHQLLWDQDVVRINSGKEYILRSLSNIHDPRPQRAAPSRSHNTLPLSRRRDSSPLKGARQPKVAPIAFGRRQSIVAPIYKYPRNKDKIKPGLFQRA